MVQSNAGRVVAGLHAQVILKALTRLCTPCCVKDCRSDATKLQLELLLCTKMHCRCKAKNALHTRYVPCAFGSFGA